MTKKTVNVNDGYKPSDTTKGYQPKKGGTSPATGGYQPTTSQGTNPGNKPPPKKP